MAPVSQAFPLMPHSIIPAALQGRRRHERSVDAEACRGIIQGHLLRKQSWGGTWVFLACRAWLLPAPLSPLPARDRTRPSPGHLCLKQMDFEISKEIDL